MWEKGGINYALYRSIQRTHHVYVQWLLQDRHTLWGYQRMAWQEQTAAKEISLEYLTEEKFYPLSTIDEYFEAPYEECPITICGQTVILTNGELAAALLSLPKYDRVSNPQDVKTPAKKNGVLSHGESEAFAL